MSSLDPITSAPMAWPRARRLGAADDAAVARLVALQPGQGLFIASTVLSYGYDYPQVHLWGQFAAEDAIAPEALLLMTSAGACLYAPDLPDLAPLAVIIRRERPRFVMGRGDLVAAVMPCLPRPAQRSEEHAFADLPRHRLRPPPAPPAGASVRRATRADVPDLVALYRHSAGFEDLAPQRLATIMQQRVTHYRTMLARTPHSLIAAASTSAETETAAMIGGVWTAPSVRGQGYGAAVVGALCAELWHERRHPYLFYLQDNAAAARLYARLGFRVTGDWRIVHL